MTDEVLAALQRLVASLAHMTVSADDDAGIEKIVEHSDAMRVARAALAAATGETK